jgi:hypothetical protein
MVISDKCDFERGVSPRLKIWPGDLDLWLWKSIGFQILLRTKYVQSLVKIHWRMLVLELLTKLGTYLVLKRIWNPIYFQGHMSKIKVTGSNFYHITSWMLRGKILTWLFWPLTYEAMTLKINRVSDYLKD